MTGLEPATTILLQRVTSNSLSWVSKHLERKRIKSLNTKNSHQIAQKLGGLENVKTLWASTSAINIHDFYYPAKIEKPDGEIVSPEQLNDLESNKNILIEGLAGQGKSIFLRYLASQEIRQKNAIPLFLELRKINELGSLENLIDDGLKRLGFIVDNELKDDYFADGNFSIFLDGFDEVPIDYQSSVIADIEMFFSLHPDTQVVVSSRPQSDIHHVNGLNVCQIKKLSAEDFKPFIEKVYPQESNAEKIVSEIQGSPTNIGELLTSPLLLTLLVLIYNTENSVPESVTSFYGKLFNVLFIKHDGSKPGFKRETHSNLSEHQLEHAFSCFCFLSRQDQKTSLTYEDANHYAIKARNATGYDFRPESFFGDLKDVTCLLVEEGLEYHFIHKSIQEYFSARFVKSSENNFAEKFYEKARETPGFWNQELVFLKEIDAYRCAKFCLLPMLAGAISDWENLDDHTLFTSMEIETDLNAPNHISFSVPSMTFSKTPLHHEYSSMIDDHIQDYTVPIILKNISQSDKDFELLADMPGAKNYEGGNICVDILSAVKFFEKEESIWGCTNDLLKKLNKEYDFWSSVIKRQDQHVNLLE